MADTFHRYPGRHLPVLLAGLLGTALTGELALAASANVSPSSGAGGRLVTLTSSGFDSEGVGYNTGFYALPNFGFIGACPAQNPANCSIQVNLPAFVPGEFTIEAHNSIGETATATYTVASPQFSISPGCGPAGTTVTATGKFFTVGYDAGLQFDGSGIPGANPPDAGGGFSRSFVVPGGTADGNHPVLGSNSVGNSQGQEFRIPCVVVGEVTDKTGPIYRCVANCDAPDVGDRTRVPVNPGDPITQDDRFEVDAGGRATLTFEDNTQLTLGPGTTLNVNDYVFDDGEPTHNTQRYNGFGGLYTFLSGTMNKDDGTHAIEKPAGAIGIRGTWFATRPGALPGQEEVYLSTGEITVTPNGTGITSVFNGPVTVLFDANGVISLPFVDGDADGVADPVDSCVTLANSTQCDADGDGFGNRCDGDLNNNGATNAQDTVLFRAQLGQPSPATGRNKADLNCNGAVNAQDNVLFRGLLGAPPGPSGLAP